MKKVKISLAMLSGEIEPLGARILIPFNTDKSQFSKEIPRRMNLIFEGFMNEKGKLEYRFNGIDGRCWCDECNGKSREKE